MLWSVTFRNDKKHRTWTFGKIVKINVRNGYVQVFDVSGWMTRENPRDFTSFEIMPEEWEEE